jgi:diacylglycerol kinase family enzyme
LNPNAIINDNILDMSIFDKVSRARLLTALPFALINKVEKVKEAKLYKIEKVNLKLKKPYYIHCDGEIISDKLIAGEIALLKSKIRTISKR